MLIRLRLNGSTTELDVAPMRRLLDVLREELRLTGAQEGCGEGQCGSCTVLLDNEPVHACMVVIGQCDGREVVTVEGLGHQHAQRALAEVACAACAPGVLVSTVALLKKHPSPTDQQIREALAGHLCRCTGYQRIVDGVRVAAAHLTRASSNGSAH